MVAVYRIIHNDRGASKHKNEVEEKDMQLFEKLSAFLPRRELESRFSSIS
jgi:hypothetical protein